MKKQTVHTLDIDRSVFKQSEFEKERAKRIKKQHKQELKKAYGSNHKKFLNTPQG